ncbi:hypothetical protein CK222_22025 [Mesorhizobium sp. WSM3866]|nr:hypothetical protein CK222_22025 [Mesorhizobium sp. WSM3866]
MLTGEFESQRQQTWLHSRPKEAADFRRGFRIPDNKRQDYYQLMRVGQYRSRDCAQILGLLTTQSPSME